MRTAREKQADAADHIGQLLLGTVMTKTFFMTTSRYYGIGPLDMRPDDVVVFVLYGSNAPFVLRPVSANEHDQLGIVTVDGEQDLHYRLKGDFYVHGFMKGEALDDKNRVVQGMLLC
jgi:hypothetical protein